MKVNKAIVEVSNLSKRYGFRYALKDINLSIPENKIIGLIAPNGSGKSTLLKLIAGLLQPSVGKVSVNGKLVNRLTSKDVAFLSDGDSLYPFYTVRETLHFAQSLYPDWNQKKAEEMCEKLKLELDKKVKALSKGNLGRLKIILALSRNVPLILMDEPLSGLDPMTREDILKIFASYVEFGEQTILLSTHEVSEVEYILDHVIMLREGELIYSGDVEQIREQDGKSILAKMREVIL